MPAFTDSGNVNAYCNLGTVVGTVIKESAGNVYSFDVTSGTTALRYFQLFNAGTNPANGATPTMQFTLGSVPAGGASRVSCTWDYFYPYQSFGNGIAWAMSSTSGTLGTASITATDYTVNIRYL